MFFLSSLKFKIISMTIFVFLIFLIWIGCNETSNKIQRPDFTPKKIATFQGIPLSEFRLKPQETSIDNPYIQAVSRLKDRYEEKIFSIEGVIGFGITYLEKKERIAYLVEIEPAITPENKSRLPKNIEGIPIVSRIVGRLLY